MEGDTNYRELNNSDLTLASVQFQYLGIRNITNATDAFYQIKPWIALRGGFQHSDRKIRSAEIRRLRRLPEPSPVSRATS